MQYDKSNIADNEKKSEIIQEIVVGDKELYYFSDYFKSNSLILDCIVQKYKSEKKGILKKNIAFYTKEDIERDNALKRKRLQQVSAYSQMGINIENSQVLAMCEAKNHVFLITKDIICYQNKEEVRKIEKIEDLRKADKAGIKKNNGMMYYTGELPNSFCELINELIVLKINIKLFYNLHPLAETKKGWDRTSKEEREKFVQCMLWIIWSTEKMYAGQILRLEVVSRSLYLSSNFILGEIDIISKLNAEECREQFYNGLPERKEYLVLLYHEMVILQWLGHDIDFGKMKQELRRRIGLSDKCFRQLDSVICASLENMAAWRQLHKELHDNRDEENLIMPIQMQKVFDDRLQISFIGGR